MMSQIQKTLKKFGLTSNEAAVYQQILRDGDTSPFRLSRETKIPRTTVYEIISDLSLKGLIELEKSEGLMKQQTKVRAKNPSVLRQIIWQRRAELTNLDVDIVEVLSDLRRDYHGEESGAMVAFHPGVEGAKEVLLAESEGDLPAYVFDYQTPMDAYGKNFINEWVAAGLAARRNSKYIPKEIFPLNDWSRHVTTYQYGRDKSYIRKIEFRYVDNPIFNLKERISIKGEKVRIVANEGGEIWGLVVSSASLARSLESIFWLVWQTATPVTDEVVKSWGKSEFLEAEKKRKKR